jgi:hypothetical protein
MGRRTGAETEGDGPSEEPGIDDVLDDLEELEALVDSPDERERVRETMRTVRRVRRDNLLLSIRDEFGSRDAGEAFVGSFLFGIPMIVEDGALDVGAYIATRPLFFGLTVLLGVGLVVGLLHAAGAEAVEADLLFGVLPLRLPGLLVIAATSALVLMTIWGRADWATPAVALGQVTFTATVMAVGASLGDILPE